MAENNEELKIEISKDEEATTLKPAIVRIEDIRIEELGEKKARKVICICKHPDKEMPIHISEIKYEKKGQLEVAGLWVNKNEKNQIRKHSALAAFLTFLHCSCIESLKGKDIPTITGDRGYLCFKAY